MSFLDFVDNPPQAQPDNPANTDTPANTDVPKNDGTPTDDTIEKIIIVACVLAGIGAAATGVAVFFKAKKKKTA